MRKFNPGSLGKGAITASILASLLTNIPDIVNPEEINSLNNQIQNLGDAHENDFAARIKRDGANLRQAKKSKP